MQPTPLSDDLGENIRAEMGRQRISMTELSRRTRMARSTLAFQINGGTLAVGTLLRVAKALGVPASELLPESQEAIEASA